jgi:hypothetical protein
MRILQSSPSERPMPACNTHRMCAYAPRRVENGLTAQGDSSRRAQGEEAGKERRAGCQPSRASEKFASGRPAGAWAPMPAALGAQRSSSRYSVASDQGTARRTCTCGSRPPGSRPSGPCPRGSCSSRRPPAHRQCAATSGTGHPGSMGTIPNPRSAARQGRAGTLRRMPAFLRLK